HITGSAGWKANSIESIQRRRGSFDDEEEEEEFFDAASEMDTSPASRDSITLTVSAAPSSTGGCRVLFLVLHGGSALVGQHYRCLAGRFAVRLVSVPPLVAEALQALTTVSPYQYRLQRGAASQADASVTLAYDHIPMATVPLLFTSSPEYASTLQRSASLATAQGGIVGYDVLTRVRQCRKSDGVNGGGVGNRAESASRFRLGVGVGFPATRAPAASARAADAGSARRLQSLTEGAQSAGFDGGEYRLEFDVSDLFLLGCPLALVLAYRRVNSQKDNPCGQVYNLFHTSDPCSFRMEPLLATADPFALLAPVQLPSTACCRAADGQPLSVLEAVNAAAETGGGGGGEGDGGGAAGSSRQLSRQDSNSFQCQQQFGVVAMCRRWWGPKRLDYSLHCPDTLSRFPINAMPLLFHASYWESADAAAFILRQFVDAASVAELLEITQTPPSPSPPWVATLMTGRQREKWRNRANAIKLKNAAPNHRANDVIVAEGQAQVLTAAIHIDVHVMSQPPSSGEWSYVGSCNTDSHGKAVFCFLRAGGAPPTSGRLPNVSIMGADPKVRPGAVDVVRHWQDLGYLLVYISARPDMQQRRVVGWLAQHNFPHGMVFFMDGFNRRAAPAEDRLPVTKLAGQAGLLIHAAYGSSKDIAVYQSLNL
uniref:DDHD domain-containing protein n=1 Tax=Macrostomum lignano TaxID=282301 RepID=A0A1I8FNB1_9PLAT